jgi:CSLREA domain-containing protein/uncharacterized repeat protein (TIGR01451 family)
MTRGLRILIVAACFALFAVPAQAGATDFVVTKTADTNDGVCSADDCSLREATVAANTSPPADTLSLPSGNYVLTLGTSLQIANSLAITGSSAITTVIDGNSTSGIFDVQNDSTVFSLSGVTLQHGRASNGSAIVSTGTLLTLDGVMLRANSSAPASTGFGTVKLAGTGSESLTVRNSTFADNTVGGAGQTGFGGAIWCGPNAGTHAISLDNTTLSGNRAGGAGGAGFGAGISLDVSGTASVAVSINHSTIVGNASGGTTGAGFGGSTFFEALGASAKIDLDIVNTTISGNSAANGAANGYGAGLYATGGGAHTILNSTIVDNSVLGTGGGPGGIYNSAGFSVKNSIIANNRGPGIAQTNCDGTIVSQGHNIEDADTCGLIAVGDQRNTDPKIDGFADNGGPTLTRSPLSGSPAIDAGANDGCPATDQRGGSRPQPAGGYCDVGAFEVGGLADLATTMTASPGTLGQGDTLTYSITATNNGPDQATGVKIALSLAKGMTVSSAKPSQGSCAANGIECTLGTFAKGSSATIAVKVKPSVIGSAVAVSNVSSDAADPLPSNNSAQTSTNVRLGLSGLAIKRGTTISYRLFQKAKVKFTVQRPVRGHVVKGKCKSGKGSGTKVKRCTAYKAIPGSFTASGKSGLNKKKFNGKLRGKRLKAGKYRLSAQAYSGKRLSPTKSVAFKRSR